MIETLLAITKAGRPNFIFPAGLGDTALCCGLKETLEAVYGPGIHFIVKPAHKVVMKMYAVDDYSVYTFSEAELRGIALDNGAPRAGQLYVAHPVYSGDAGLVERWLAGNLSLEQFFRLFFKLDGLAPVAAPVWYPEPDAAMKKTAGFPAAPEKTALLLPGARSVLPLGQAFWVRTAKRLRREGYAVIQSYHGERFAIPDVPAMSGGLEAALAAASVCARVYSLRSGICDLVKGRANLTVFYPDRLSYSQFLIEGPNVENILAGTPVKIKQKIKNILKKLPPVKQVSERFNAVGKRLDELETRPTGSPGFMYNDLIKLGRMAGRPLTLSALGKTWLFDLDGTLARHNGYRHGKDELLPGVRDFFEESIGENDAVVILTSRKEEFRGVTERFLAENNIRYDSIIFNLPAGERILFNDSKPSGLNTAVAVSCARDRGLEGMEAVCDGRL